MTSTLPRPNRDRPAGERRLSVVAGLVLGLVGLVLLGALGPTAAGAAPSAAAGAAPSAAAGDRRVVELVQLGGQLDPVQLQLVRRALADAAADGAYAVVVQLDADEAAVPQAEVDAVERAIRDAKVPVAVWVGPAGKGRAAGPAYQLLRAADVRGIAPGARIAHEPATPPAVSGRPSLGNRDLGDEQALQAGLVDLVAATPSNFIGLLDGRTAKGVTFRTLAPADPNRPNERGLDPGVNVRFIKAGLVDRSLHAVGTPDATYFFFLLGLLLVVFEMYAVGIGIVGVCAAASLALSAYGLGILPVRWWALALLVAAVIAFAVDIQAGVPRLWTGIGTVLLAIGSLFLYQGRMVSWPVLLVVVVGTLLFVLYGVPSAVRTRFSTPTIGREQMVGAVGVARSDIDPEGTVEINGAVWKARTFPAKITAGDPVQVRAIDGMVLEVDPEGTEYEPLKSVERAAEKARRRAEGTDTP